MSNYTIIKLNWMESTKITTLILSPKHNRSITYTAQIPHENNQVWEKFFDLMNEWDPIPWTVNDASSTITFINNKHPTISVVKNIKRKYK